MFIFRDVGTQGVKVVGKQPCTDAGEVNCLPMVSRENNDRQALNDQNMLSFEFQSIPSM